ncbi:Protein TolR [Candidatus Providencia siddallii]|uniref:Protein TolR n=1 Tax=Candidatus Providencia siddallii TaxID=1715285 RepID=A0A0M6W998_9GAMM|nr:Protein TolR [Candidatus Providencia siddallii]
MMVRNRVKRFNLKSEINVVPLLDVLLVLLLTFIVTSPLITQSLDVDLPKAEKTKKIGAVDTSQVILEVVDIDHYNIFVNGKRIESIHKNDILSTTKEQIEKNPKVFFLVGGDKNVPYNEIIKVLNILHSSGIKSVGLLTQPV